DHGGLHPLPHRHLGGEAQGLHGLDLVPAPLGLDVLLDHLVGSLSGQRRRGEARQQQRCEPLTNDHEILLLQVVTNGCKWLRAVAMLRLTIYTAAAGEKLLPAGVPRLATGGAAAPRPGCRDRRQAEPRPPAYAGGG